MEWKVPYRSTLSWIGAPDGLTGCCPSEKSVMAESSLVALSWLPVLLFLRPNIFKLHRRRLFTRLGGIGGFVCTFIFGWVMLYGGWWEGGGNDNCVNIWEDDDNVGNEVEGEEDGTEPEKSDVAELLADSELQFWLVSGKGYSNRVLSLAKGVPTIWDEGELRGISSRCNDFGRFVIDSGEEGIILSVEWSVDSTTVAIDIESDISTWEVRKGSCGRNAYHERVGINMSNEKNTLFQLQMVWRLAPPLDQHRHHCQKRFCLESYLWHLGSPKGTWEYGLELEHSLYKYSEFHPNTCAHEILSATVGIGLKPHTTSSRQQWSPCLPEWQNPNFKTWRRDCTLAGFFGCHDFTLAWSKIIVIKLCSTFLIVAWHPFIKSISTSLWKNPTRGGGGMWKRDQPSLFFSCI